MVNILSIRSIWNPLYVQWRATWKFFNRFQPRSHYSLIFHCVDEFCRKKFFYLNQTWKKRIQFESRIRSDENNKICWIANAFKEAPRQASSCWWGITSRCIYFFSWIERTLIFLLIVTLHVAYRESAWIIFDNMSVNNLQIHFVNTYLLISKNPT